jgi:protoporphyrinogen/coproporphyrinogen III oxidase
VSEASVSPRDRFGSDRRRHVVVIGGGISGLAAAWALRRASPSVRVSILEGAPKIGGKIAAVEVAGRDIDAGAESLLARRPEAVDLVRAVGLADSLIHPAVSGSSVWTRGRLRPLPAGQLMGIPGDLRALAASHVLSGPGLTRVPLDLVLPATQIGTDVAIGRYVAARMGREVVDRLVEPLLGGVYAGHADELSLSATVPQLAPYVRTERSLLDAVGQILTSTPGAPAPAPGARRTTEPAPGTGALPAAGSDAQPKPVFASVIGGLHGLPGAVAAASGAQIRTGTTVRGLERTPDGWLVIVGSARAPETIAADAVVLAVPAGPAARLLRDVAPHVATELAGIEYASVAVVTFAFAANGAGPAGQLGAEESLRGTGFLVPPVERRTIKAVTYLSRKWRQQDADRSDPVIILRASVGRHRDVADLQRDDAELAGAVLADIATATGITASPIDVAVSRWGGALPQYAVGHPQRVTRILREVEPLPGLAVCGAAYQGVGIAACVASATSAATRILEHLDAWEEWRHG